MNYILASASPRRKELLAIAVPSFTVCVPNTEESIDPAWSAAEATVALARQKAAAVAAQHPHDCVIAADTIVELDGVLLGKPVDAADAARMLRLLSGREHRVVTGVCVVQNQEAHAFSQETRVRFYSLSDKEIADYVATGEPMDKAGAYGIQDLGALLVEGITGDYLNVVGLPLAKLARLLRELGD